MNGFKLATLPDQVTVISSNVGLLPLIIIGMLVIALGMALDEWLRDNNQDCRRLAISLGTILGLRLIYVLLVGQSFLPALRPFIESAGLILIIWAFTRPLFGIPERADHLLTALLGISVAGAILTAAVWLDGRDAISPSAFSDHGVQLIWHLTQVGLTGLAVWFVVARRSELRWTLALLFGVAGAGHAVSLFGHPSAMDLSNTITFPLLALASYQMITNDLRSFGEELRSVSERSLSRTREQVFLLEISQTVNSPLDMLDMLDVIANSSGLAFDADRVLLLLGEENETGGLRVAARYQPLVLARGESLQTHAFLKDIHLLDRVVRQGDQFRLEVIGKSPQPAMSERDGEALQQLLNLEELGPAIIQPLLLKGRTLGLAIAARLPGRPDFTDDECRLFDATASLISASLQNSQLYRDLKQSNEALIQANKDLQLAYERLRELDQLKSSFIGLITHELRSPFVGLDLSLQLLHRHGLDNLTEAQREQITQVERGVQHARSMVDSLVSFASLLSRQGSLQFVAVDFIELIQRVVSFLQPLAESRNIEICVEASMNALCVDANPERMADAVQHLVHNAIKFGRAGGRATIRCWANDNRLLFEVEDNGAGIPASKMETLWDQFTQVADAFRRGVEGIGLGLPLVKLTVEAHGGEVAAQSVEGSGSVFGFWIPLKQTNL